MIVVACYFCKRTVSARQSNGEDAPFVYDPHEAYMVGVQCIAVGTDVPPSIVPSWHALHSCGHYCDGAERDGQMLLFSECAAQRRRGPPSAVDRLAALAQVEGRIGGRSEASTT